MRVQWNKCLVTKQNLHCSNAIRFTRCIGQVINCVLSTAAHVFRAKVVVLRELFDKITRAVSAPKIRLNPSLWGRRVVDLGRACLLVRCGRTATGQTANGAGESVKTSTKRPPTIDGIVETDRHDRPRRSEDDLRLAHDNGICKRNVSDSWPLLVSTVVGMRL